VLLSALRNNFIFKGYTIPECCHSIAKRSAALADWRELAA